jgi:Tol biopolymer transport system component
VTPCGSETIGPDFTADGQRLFYLDAPAVFGGPLASPTISSLDGTPQRVLPYGLVPLSHDGPSGSPTGGRIAFADDSGPAPRIVIARVDGRGYRVLRPGGRFEDPRWSPAGGRMTLTVRGRAGGYAIRLASTRTGRLGRLLASPGYEPDWSPEGKRIVYAEARGIFSVHVDGGRRRWLYRDGDATAHSPVWSPDGRWVVWIRADVRRGGGGRASADYSLWRVPAAGGRAERLTDLGSLVFDEENEMYSDITPDLAWQPLPARADG